MEKLRILKERKDIEKMKKNSYRMQRIQETFLGKRIEKALLYTALFFIGTLFYWVAHPGINLFLLFGGSLLAGGATELLFGIDQAELHPKRRNERQKLEDYTRYEIQNEQLYYRNIALKQASTINKHSQSLQDILVIKNIEEEQPLQQEKEALESLYQEELKNLDVLAAKNILDIQFPKDFRNLKGAIFSLGIVGVISAAILYVSVPTMAFYATVGTASLLSTGYFAKKSIDEHRAYRHLEKEFLGTKKIGKAMLPELIEDKVNRLSVIRFYMEENKRKFEHIFTEKRKEEIKERVRARYADLLEATPPTPKIIPYEESELKAKILELQK